MLLFLVLLERLGSWGAALGNCWVLEGKLLEWADGGWWWKLEKSSFDDKLEYLGGDIWLDEAKQVSIVDEMHGWCCWLSKAKVSRFIGSDGGG